MARQPRFLLSDQDTWYHVTSRVAGALDWYPLQEPEVAEAFLRILFHYLSVYFCEMANYVVLGTHFHLILLFRVFRKLSQRELERRAAKLHSKKADRPKTKRQWRRLNERLFSLSDLMADVKREMARWFNKRYGRRGPLFAERFSSTVLGDLQAVLDCMLYVDLNPLRAGLVERPEEWKWGALSQRVEGKQKGLISLSKIMLGGGDLCNEYWTRLYWRGGIDEKGTGRVIDPEVVASEIRRGFRRGEYLERESSFSRGVALGRLHQVGNWLEMMREKGIYHRRIHPIVQMDGKFCTLREQRGPYRKRPKKPG